MVIILDWVLVLIKQSLHRGSCGRSFTTEAYFLIFFFFSFKPEGKTVRRLQEEGKAVQ